MNKPIVSVIIPTYNREEVLPRAIKSVLNQIFKDFELVIVDDGSTDNTKDVVKNFNDDRVKYFYQKNQGVSAARNLGIKKARGKYIAFLDSDDEWLPEKIEKQISLFKNNTSLDFIGCKRIVVNNKKEYKEKIDFNKEEVSSKKYFKLSLKGNLRTVCLTSGLVVKRKIIEKVGFFDKNLPSGQDLDMWWRIFEKGGKFDFVDDYLYKYYEDNNDSLSSSFKGNYKNQIYLFKKHYNFIKRYPKVHSRRLQIIGTHCMLAGKNKLARKFFKKANQVSKRAKNYVLILLSFFGSNVFKFTLFAKKFLYKKIGKV